VPLTHSLKKTPPMPGGGDEIASAAGFGDRPHPTISSADSFALARRCVRFPTHVRELFRRLKNRLLRVFRVDAERAHRGAPAYRVPIVQTAQARRPEDAVHGR